MQPTQIQLMSTASELSLQLQKRRLMIHSAAHNTDGMCLSPVGKGNDIRMRLPRIGHIPKRSPPVFELGCEALILFSDMIVYARLIV
jgi:hypothetical protein